MARIYNKRRDTQTHTDHENRTQHKIRGYLPPSPSRPWWTSMCATGLSYQLETPRKANRMVSLHISKTHWMWEVCATRYALAEEEPKRLCSKSRMVGYHLTHAPPPQYSRQRISRKVCVHPFSYRISNSYLHRLVHIMQSSGSTQYK